MNILPKKSWHVRTRKNIEKVRKDEAQAAEEENKRQERIRLAEREARTDFLRKKARGKTNQEDSVNPDIFQGVDHGQGDKRINDEHTIEEKRKKEEWEQRVGILTYLHKKDSDVDSPWYLKPHKERLASNSKRGTQDSSLGHELEDPLLNMNKYLKQMKPPMVKAPTATRSSRSFDKSDKRKYNESRETSSSTTTRDPKEENLEKLRQERLKRESKERIRQEKLLNASGMTPRNTSGNDERCFRFNSQFNPHLAKN